MYRVATPPAQGPRRYQSNITNALTKTRVYWWKIHHKGAGLRTRSLPRSALFSPPSPNSVLPLKTDAFATRLNAPRGVGKPPPSYAQEKWLPGWLVSPKGWSASLHKSQRFSHRGRKAIPHRNSSRMNYPPASRDPVGNLRGQQANHNPPFFCIPSFIFVFLLLIFLKCVWKFGILMSQCDPILSRRLFFSGF